MNINKETLKQALEIVKPGLSSKSVIEQSTNFCFIKGKVVTYNDEISVRHPVEGLELEGAIPAENLYKFLSKIKEDKIDLTVKGSEIIITSGRSKAGLTMQTEIKLPLEEISGRKRWKDIPENFIKYLSFAMTCCSRDMSKPVLTCVNVSKNTVEASDGFRIVQCTLKGEMPLNPFLLPSTSVLQVVKLKPTMFAEGTGWVHFKTDAGTEISCRTFEDAFPEVTSHLKVEGSALVFPKTLEEVLNRAEVFAKRDNMLDESVTISLGDNKLKVSSKSEEGWFEEDLNMKFDESLSFKITPFLLKSILSETQDWILSKTKLKCRGENWEFITVLRG